MRLFAIACLAAALNMAAMAMFISGGPPSAQEINEAKAGLARAYDALAAQVEAAARRLKR